MVLGDRPRKPAELVDLHVLGCVFGFPGGFDTAAGGAAMGHPAAAVAWLADALGRAATSGSSRARSCSPAGSPPPCRCAAGDRITAEFDGLGPVEVHGG